jgi:bacterioferritin-associated ferredoxin
MFVCVCNAITEAQVRESVAAGADTLEALQLETGLGSCCGTCTEVASSFLPGACDKASATCAAVHCAPSAYRTAPVPQAPAVHTPGLAGCAPVRWVSRAPHAPQTLAKAA